jgi:hypothetical protein
VALVVGSEVRGTVDCHGSFRERPYIGQDRQQVHVGEGEPVTGEIPGLGMATALSSRRSASADPSGMGREGGLHSLEFYSELRNVCIQL